MSEQHPYRATIPPIPEGTTRPLWSVMIPTYNCANYLRETLASILAQDPGPEIMQIEVIDDCSTKDDPQAVVEELGRGRVEFYRQPQNVGHTRNFETCLQRSRGKLIHQLHGDDYVLDGFYRKMQQAFEDNPDIGAAFCRHIFMDEHSHWQTISQLEQPESGVLSNFLERIASFQHIQTPSIVVRRKVYELLGGFDSRLSWTEDWEMWVRIAANFPIWYEIEPLAVYRKHSGSNTGRYMCTAENLRDSRRAINIFKSYLPSSKANEIASKARENWALYTLQFVVPQYLTEGNTLAATAQIREALQCHHSFKVIMSLFSLFKSTGKRWFLQKLRLIYYKFIHINIYIHEYYIQPIILQNSIKHIYGLKKVNYGIDELIITCVVRNGELYIKSFIEHHFSLGIKHIVFLDNGSTDETIKIAKNYDNVTILHSSCPYRKYEKLMKKYLVKRFSRNRWNLFVDIDEHFDYPFSEMLSLNSLLGYLNKNSYTAVVAQMLDMFSNKSLASLKSTKDDNIKSIYDYYDISNIRRDEYPFEDVPPLKDIKLHIGGIRKSLFGSDNWLTKAALVFVNPKIELFVGHHYTKNAKVADFTCVLLHYPFTSYFYKKVMEAVESDRYALSASHEYKMYWNKIRQNPELSLKQETACRLETLDDLVKKGFLVLSQNYIHWAKANDKQSKEFSNQPKNNGDRSIGRR